MQKNLVGDILDRNYDFITFISDYPFLGRPRVTICADIIKILTIFIKTIF